MEKLKNLLTKVFVGAKVRLSHATEGIDGLIITIGLILVALVVILLFKDKIGNTFNNFMGDADNKINNLGQGM